MSETSGRSKGRSRGRARGGTDQPPKRPGEGQPTQEAPVSRGRSRGGAGPPAQPATAAPGVQTTGPAAPAATAGGRASHRGGAVSAGRPDVQPPTGQMQQLSLGTGDAGQRQAQGELPRPIHAGNKKGRSGQGIRVLANFFRLRQSPDWILCQYNVSFNPPIESKSMRVAFVKGHTDVFGKTSAFDGTILFLPIRLQTDPYVYTVKRNYDNQMITVTVKLTNEVSPMDNTWIQLLNIIFRRDLSLIGMKQIGRHYFSPDKRIEVQRHKLEVWPGFSTSICPYENEVLLCVDLAHKVLRQVTALDVMYDIHSTKPSHMFKEECTKQLIGETVMTRYNNKTYRIDDIDFNQTPESTFRSRDTDVKYVDYYKKAHGKEITDANQPMLVSKPQKKDIRRGQEGPIYLVPELCCLTGLTDRMRSDFQVMKDLAVHTRIGPADRCNTLKGFIDLLSRNQQVKAEMNGWGLEFASELVSIQSRCLPPEKIFQRNKNYSYNQADADWSRSLRGGALISTVNISNWLLLFTARDEGNSRDMEETLKRVAGPMGIQMSGAKMVKLNDDRTDTYLRALQSNMTDETQIVVCVVPTNRADRYNAIKRLCCVTHPVPSQVVVGRTISKKPMLMSVCTKISIQINCKLGGEVWALEIPLKKSMVIGIDTFHEKRSRSVAGFVASLNDTYTRYYSRARLLDPRQELHDHLKVMTVAALKQYHELNGCPPERIFIYRDGVGDGQLQTVGSHEVKQLKEAFTQYGGDTYSPKIAFIVVKKRISSRFFAIPAGNGPPTNPLPGTIVDDVVTRRDWYDFFVVSQAVRQGTVSPTHYNVVFDTSGLQPEHIQRLTYKLTHLYYNWPGTIRVPAPCQYAHKLAFLVGQSVKDEPSQHLANRLFFL